MHITETAYPLYSRTITKVETSSFITSLPSMINKGYKHDTTVNYDFNANSGGMHLES